MKLQLALDTLSLEESIRLADQLGDYVDIIEVGTPMIMEYGLQAVRRMKAAFPQKTVLADAKIMDAGRFEADKCFDAGADIVTVLGVANDLTVAGALESARNHGGRLMVDMIEAHPFEKRVSDMELLGVDIICVHTAFDVKSTGKDSLAELRLTNEIVSKAQIALAGGITPENLHSAIETGADIVVVGTAIISASDRLAVARSLKEQMD
ncbi:MAG: orotidine 5'-phosphate decarboxylase [Erysipelotrichaceae bacterium]|nr:orotidine 5'-phosphate decarboxylase [Erysipelotrichaceae bacterium]MBO4538333.1 orotidine 5'-phosphate decarboxylase [Erysipelotrichaceae bacterium]